MTGRDGKVLIDAGIPASRPQLTEALNNLGGDSIKHLINTHWHFDHTDGNEWLHSAGAEITAHENTRKHLSVTTRVEGWNFTFPLAPEGAFPTKVFKTEQKLHRDSRKSCGLKEAGQISRRSYSCHPNRQIRRKMGGFVINGDFFTRLVYADV